jgi:hypothetical protein
VGTSRPLGERDASGASSRIRILSRIRKIFLFAKRPSGGAWK